MISMSPFDVARKRAESGGELADSASLKAHGPHNRPAKAAPGLSILPVYCPGRS